MEEHIEYYTDFIAHLNEKIREENTKLLDYESMLLKEQRTLSEYSFFQRLFSSNRKFIHQLEKLVAKTTKNIEDYRNKIEDNKEKFVTFGTQKMIDESAELKKIEQDILECVAVGENFKHMIMLVKVSINDTLQGMHFINQSNTVTFKHSKEPFYVQGFNSYLSALNRINDLKRFMNLEGFSKTIYTEENVSKNINKIIEDTLSDTKIFSSAMLEKLKDTTKYPCLELLTTKYESLARIGRNLEILLFTLEREHEKIQSDYSDLIIRRESVENNYRVLFLNRIKKTNSLVLF